MRNLLIKVDCGEKYCLFCDIDVDDDYCCNLFKTKLRADDVDALRCPECLKAEKEAENAQKL